jgi:hypothetical protein
LRQPPIPPRPQPFFQGSHGPASPPSQPLASAPELIAHSDVAAQRQSRTGYKPYPEALFHELDDFGATIVGEVQRRCLSPQAVRALADFLVRDFADEGVTPANLAHVLGWVLPRVLDTGYCVACAVACFAPLAPGGVFVALAVCTHLEEARSLASYLRHRGDFTLTAGESFDPGAIGASLSKLFGPRVPVKEIVQMVAACLASFNNPGSYTASFSAVVSHVNVVLAQQFVPFSAVAIAEALFGSLLDLTAGPSFSFDDVTAALLRGVASENLPVWLASGLVLVGRLCGLSVAAAMTNALVPSVVLSFCRAGHITVGDLAGTAIDGARDLVLRSSSCYHALSLAPLFESVHVAEGLKDAAKFVATLPHALPGDGEGYALTESRLHHAAGIITNLRIHWQSQGWGPEKGQTLRLLTQAELKYEELCLLFHQPSGRPRPINAGLVGPPGVGKTMVANIVAELTLAGFGLPFDDSMVFCKDAQFRFYDGFDSRRHRAIFVDEVGAISKDKTEGAVLDDLLKIMGEAAHLVPIAKAEQINTQYARQYCTVLSSNVDDFGVDGQLSAPAAFFRRLAFKIDLAAHEGARLPDSCEIDPAKLAAAGSHDHIWRGRVMVPRILSATHINWTHVGFFTSKATLVELLAPLIKAKVAGNHAYVAASEGHASGISSLIRSQFAPTPEAPLPGVANPMFDVVEPTAGETLILRAAPDVAPWSFWLRGSLYSDCLRMQATNHERYMEAAAVYGVAGCVCILSGLLFIPGLVLLLLSVALTLRFWVAAWYLQLMQSTKVGELPPGARALAWAGGVALGYLLHTSFVPWWLRSGLAMRLISPLAMLRGAVAARAARSVSELAIPLKLAVFLGLTMLGAKLIQRGRAWWEGKPVPVPEAMASSPTSGDVGYEDVRRLMRENPASWEQKLKETLRAPDDGAWRDQSKAAVALGMLSRDLLPRAPSGGQDAVMKTILSNVFKINIYGDGSPVIKTVTGLCLGGDFYVVPFHGFNKMDGPSIELLARSPAEAGLLRKRVPISWGVNAQRVREHDAAVIHVPGMPRQPTLRWFAESVVAGSPPAGTKACYPAPVGNGFAWADGVVTVPACERTRMPVGHPYHHSLVAVLSFASEATMSGTPCLVATPGGLAVLGLIVGNCHPPEGPRAFVDVLSAPELLDAMRVVTPSPNQVTLTCGLDCSNLPATDKPISLQSWVCGQVGGRFAVVGSTKARVSYRSKWVTHHLAAAHRPLAAWRDAAGGDDFVKPAYKAFLSVDKSGAAVWLDPHRCKTAGAAGDTFLPPEIVRKAVAEFMSAIPERFGPDGGARPLTYEEAVFGGGGLGPLDLNKSAGATGGQKHQHVDVATRTLSPKLHEACVAYEKRLRDGLYAPDYFQTMLKAESRPSSKVAEGKTRAISPVDFPPLILARAYLGPVVHALLALGYKRTCMVVGMNSADPRQWGGAAEWLLKRAGDGHTRGGDYPIFDLNQQLDLIRAECAIYGDCARRIGYSEEDAIMVETLCFMSHFSWNCVDGVIILMIQGRNSGRYATDVGNSVQDFLKLCCAYWISAVRNRVPDPPDFRESVNSLILGDDHEQGVDPAVRHFYNSVEIARSLAPYGDGYTNSDKSLDLANDYHPIEQAVFLGRSWRRDAGMWAAPLERKRLAKSYNIVQARTTLSNAGHCEAIALNTQHELVMHGREALAEFQACLPDGPVVMPDGSSCAVRKLDYDALHAKWRLGQLVTWDSGGQFGADASPEWMDVSLTSGDAPAVVTCADEATSDSHDATLHFNKAEGAAIQAPSTDVGVSVGVGTKEDWFVRPILVASLSLTPTTTQPNGYTYAIGLIPLWMSNAAVNRRVANNRFVKNATIRLHVQIASTPMHSGLLVFGVVNGPTFRGGANLLNAAQCVQMGGVVTNVRGPNSFTMDFPLNTPAGLMVVDNSTDPIAGTTSGPVLYICQIAPLGHCSLATAPNIMINVRMCLTRAEFYGPTDLVAYTVTAGESVASETTPEGGLLSRPANILSSLLGGIGTAFPFVQPFTTPAAMVAKGVAGLASLFGFGRPALREGARPMYVTAGHDLSRAIGDDPLVVASLDPAATSAPYAGAGGWSYADQMSLPFLATRWTLCAGSSNTTEWSTTTSPGTTLITIPVCPSIIDLGSDGLSNAVLAPCMVIGGCYSFWSGEAIFKVIVPAGSLDAGRLRIFWIPGTGSTTGATLDMGQRHSAVLDISSASEMDLRVGWQSPAAVLPMPLSFAGMPNTGYTSAVFNGICNNGVLVIQTDSYLVSNQAVRSVGVKVMVRWERLTFHRQTESFWNTVLLTSGESSSGPGTDMRVCQSVDLVPSHWQTLEQLYCVSDSGEHLRPVLLRYHRWFAFMPLKSVAGITDGVYAWSVPAYGYGANGTVTPYSTTVKRFQTIFDVCQRCFSVFRGGFKHRAYFGSMGTPIVRSMHAAAQGTYNYIPGLTAVFATNAIGAYTESGDIIQGDVPSVFDKIAGTTTMGASGLNISKGDDATLWGVAIPWNSTVPWHPTQFGVGLPAATTTLDPIAMFGFAYTNGGNAQPVWAITQYMGACDDITYHGFTCGPQIAASTWPV